MDRCLKKFFKQLKKRKRKAKSGLLARYPTQSTLGDDSPLTTFAFESPNDSDSEYADDCVLQYLPPLIYYSHDSLASDEMEPG